MLGLIQGSQEAVPSHPWRKQHDQEAGASQTLGLLESINKSRRIFVKPPNCLWHAPCSTSKTMPMMELGLGRWRRRKSMRIWRRIIGRRWWSLRRRRNLHCRHPWSLHLHRLHLLHLLRRRSHSSLHTHHQVSWHFSLHCSILLAQLVVWNQLDCFDSCTVMNIVILDKWRPTCQDGKNSLLGMALGLTWSRHRQRCWQRKWRCGLRHLHCLHRLLVCA